MVGGRLCRIEIATFQARVKSPNSPGVGFIAQVFSEDHLSGILDQIWYHSLVAVVGKRVPINLCRSVPLEKWRAAVLRGAIQRVPDKDEISLPGSQHHVIPIDHEHKAGSITQQITWMQVRMTDNVWDGFRLEYGCELVEGRQQRVNRRSMFYPGGTESTLGGAVATFRM